MMNRTSRSAGIRLTKPEDLAHVDIAPGDPLYIRLRKDGTVLDNPVYVRRHEADQGFLNPYGPIAQDHASGMVVRLGKVEVTFTWAEIGDCWKTAGPAADLECR